MDYDRVKCAYLNRDNPEPIERTAWMPGLPALYRTDRSVPPVAVAEVAVLLALVAADEDDAAPDAVSDEELWEIEAPLCWGQELYDGRTWWQWSVVSSTGYNFALRQDDADRFTVAQDGGPQDNAGLISVRLTSLRAHAGMPQHYTSEVYDAFARWAGRSSVDEAVADLIAFGASPELLEAVADEYRRRTQ